VFLLKADRSCLPDPAIEPNTGATHLRTGLFSDFRKGALPWRIFIIGFPGQFNDQTNMTHEWRVHRSFANPA
jgi:hypothetical protein